ncbi:MAG TPA: OFA family MFS transporter [Clostridiaceae bacterium]|nr:OFA family MFS transporter [Clostridiaceae bacterium]
MKKNRWLLLAASIVANLCTGSAYAWSVFSLPLQEKFGWTATQVNLAYSIYLGMIPFAVIIAGKLQDKFGPRWVIFAGGLIFGIGTFLLSFTSTTIWLYFTYGILGGIGIGFIYGSTIPNTTKWFPDKKGLAGGIITGGFGIGAMIFGPLSASLIERIGILATFRYEGIAYLIIIGIVSQYITAPPKGYKPEGWEPPAPAPGVVSTAAVDLTPGQMLRTPIFWILFAMYTLACFAGLMIIGNASPIGQEQVGMSAAAAAGAVGFLSLGNTLGRVFWGWVSDVIGRFASLLIMYSISAVALFGLINASTYWPFIISVMIVAACFGGFFGIFPALTADNFGLNNLGVNYGVLFISYGIAGVIAPTLAAYLKEASGGGYSLPLTIALVVNILGALLTVVYKKMSTPKIGSD